jgi:hypothetical protein
MFLNRWTLTGTIFAGFVCIGLIGFQNVFVSQRPGVTKANFDRIKEGMTRAEVEGVLGKCEVWPTAITVGGGILSFEKWKGDDGARANLVLFDGIVAGDPKTWTPSTETITEKLCRWLRLK